MVDTLHKPLLTIFVSKKGLPTHTANRQQRWGTILLNYHFKMGYLPSNKFGHVEGLSRLIPKYKESLESTVIASLQFEGKSKITLCNSVRELPVTLDQIKQEAFRNEYINQIKTKILEKDQRTTDICSTCDDVLLYRECVVILSTLQKHILKYSMLAIQGVIG